MTITRKIVAALALGTLALAGCSSNAASDSSSAVTTVKVGASPTPHSDILSFVNESQAAAAGIKIDIIEFSDYVQPNSALADGSLDANYFQHKPYLDQQIAENGYKFSVVATVHLEPMGVYSKKVSKLADLPEGASVGIPNDPTNEGRALLIFAQQGLITLKDPTNLNSTPIDIVTNPKNLQFKELEAPQLPVSLPDLDAAVINSNFALGAGLTPSKDAIQIESPENNPYNNVLVARTEDKDKPAIKKLGELLCSAETQKYIQDKYQGEVIPAC